jgi:hypothetical protein
MRSNTYYHNLSRAPDKQNPEREKLEAQIKEYLAKGGKIKHVPLGSSTINPLTYHDPRKKK